MSPSGKPFMEEYSYLDNLPEETLVNIFYQGNEIEGLCHTSKKFHRICQDREVRKSIYLASLRRMNREELVKAFIALVYDRKRDPHTNDIAPKDLERLTWMLEYDPSLTEEHESYAVPSFSTPLELTINTEVFDLLLRYGANANDMGMIGTLPIFAEVIGTSRIQSGSRIPHALQLLAYGAKPLALEDGYLPENTYSNVSWYISYDTSFDLLLFMMENGIYDPHIKARESNGRLFNGITLKLSEVGMTSSGKYSSYTRALEYARLGVKPNQMLGRNNVTFLTLFEESDIYAPTYRSLCCFLDSLIEGLTDGEEEMSEAIHTFYQSLVRLKEPGEFNLLTLDYPHLKQLYLVNPYPAWDEPHFWSDKLRHDFPNEPLLLSNASQREQYLELYLRPRLTVVRNGREDYIYLDYHTGRGWVVCAHYLLGKELSKHLTYKSVRLAGEEVSEKRGPYLSELFCFFPELSCKELVLTEDLTSENRKVIFPRLLLPYAMRILSLDGSKAYILQFESKRFLKGFLTLCSVLDIDPQQYCTNLWKVVSG